MTCRPFVLATALGVFLAGPAGGQSLRRPTPPADSSDLRDDARRAQANFERRRVRLLPRGGYRGVGPCDEVVGRFCVTTDEGDWTPPPEPEALVEAREALLRELDSLQALVPGDGWLLGQRVWYRGEAGRWGDALTVARRCDGVEPWWCAALEGLALHGLGRYIDAEAAFRRALAGMDPEQARRWREPRRALSGAAWKVVDRQKGVARQGMLDRLWMLADPLVLVPGNDRLTAHYARWTVATLRDGARNPHLTPWGRDLEELMVRHGWEVGWERLQGRGLSLERDGVVAHDHPEGRGFLPDGPSLENPGHAGVEDLTPGRRGSRSLYAPDYAPVFLPMDGQVAVFPRSDSVVVVATRFLPRDTTERREDGPAPSWREPGDQASLPDQGGAFLLPVHGGTPLGRTVMGAEGVSVVAAPAGSYVVSVEAWSPPARRAGRLRRGLTLDTVPPDVPTLSDLLLVRGGGPDPADLAAAARLALVRPEVHPGDSVALVWEVNGLGWRPETVSYELVVERREGGFLRRIGQRLGLVDRDRPLALSWEEVGPEEPRVVLRRVALAFSDLEPGVYGVSVRARIPGRALLASERNFVVSEPPS